MAGLYGENVTGQKHHQADSPARLQPAHTDFAMPRGPLCVHVQRRALRPARGHGEPRAGAEACAAALARTRAALLRSAHVTHHCVAGLPSARHCCRGRARWCASRTGRAQSSHASPYPRAAAQRPEAAYARSRQLHARSYGVRCQVMRRPGAISARRASKHVVVSCDLPWAAWCATSA